MNKKIASAIALTLLLTSMLTLTFNIQPVKAEPKIWYVDDDGPADFHTIQEAINAANSGDTIFVKAGTYFENVAVNKTVTVIGEDSSNTIIDGNETGNVVHIIAENVTITGFTIRRSGNGYKSCYGVFVEGVLREPENVIIRKNFLSGNYIGIEFEYAANSTVQENVFSNNIMAISLVYSDRNSVIHNMVFNNSYGLDIRGHYNYVYNNTFANDTDYGIGIALSEGSSNIVRNNLITSNERCGILLGGDGRNTIAGNTISWNTYGVICADFSGMGGPNLIYHNNFLSNTIQAYEKRHWSPPRPIPPPWPSPNNWDNGYPIGGNYWSNYNETDFFFGPNQDEMGSDGIGDTPFNITEENSQDRYPLMHPWSPLPVHNTNTGLGYGTIQEAINANETLNGHTIFVEAGTYYENVVVNKVLTLIGENRETTIIDANETGTPIEIRANGVKISGFTVQKNSSVGYGIYLNNSDYCIITENSITNSGSPIRLEWSSNNVISKNNVTNNFNPIKLYWSLNNIISENDITANGNGGISLTWSFNNWILGNNITNNKVDGIYLSYSSNNSMSGNSIANNGQSGIALAVSSNNTIFRNSIVENGYITRPWFEGYGIWLSASSDNLFYHNDFINNSNEVWSLSSTDRWDHGYPSGGNYWSNYTGVDVESGPNQDLPGSDGIGDTAYIIDANHIDRYPLMNPYGSAVAIATVDIDPDVLNLKGKLKWVNAYIELPEDYNISDVDVSTLRLNMTIPAELEPTAIGDYDNDTISDLMVGFNRTAVSELALSKGIMYGNVTLTLTGKRYDGTLLEGSDVIEVRMPGDINCDGKVDVKDVALVSFAFGSYPGHPRWKLIADENEDGKIDVRDVSLIARNFGKTYT